MGMAGEASAQMHIHRNKVKYTDIAKFAGHLPHCYGNSRAIWDHTVLPATRPGPILSMFPALIVHSELKSVHPGFPVAFIF